LFYDARNVAAAADCWALGYDPLVENPCDPAGRVMVYPRVWVVVAEPSVDERVSPWTLAFHLGALTYLGTFATRKSGDYRLVFVLLTLPLLLEWAWGEPGEVRTVLGRIGFVAVVVGLYAGALSPFIGPWDELASWAIAGAFVTLLAATVPPWRGSEPAPELTMPTLGADAG
jgi:hypothetical protein